MAQTKRVTVELGFKANTQEIKKNINELATNLKQLSSMEIGLKGGNLDVARQAAKDLNIELQKAVNVDTGRLDLSKLVTSLKASGKDLTTLSSNLLKAGSTGQESFLRIARAVSSAEIPVIQINKTVKDFMENLGKTAKWQIATNAWQAIQGSIQNSFREAENLNKALNDIRIVTGYDKTVMAQFAKEANKAAKELKTTTKEYAEASLIFYQQGLSEAEVAKRAETVIKLSQITGDTARTVSDQMTAIWNNFADGTKTLEYYADAMARLGADTAASTSEIANGLEKFAAIAETVGLSYETAMASVATVIDKTRQSADVVGTAFKTIFARVQGLQLDGVTDDGVSLNKYSAALEKVGVDVLTASGELRDMDEILNDLGAKWQLLGRETQVAVAQVVGGARQYNQLLSLMDNWSEVQSNIVKAEGSTGEISKQANIWADSYEAAAKRVEEAKARVSENFLNSEDVVNLTNAFADLITWTDSFIESVGGIIPLGLTIAGLFSKKLIPIFKTGFTTLKENFSTFIGNGERQLYKTQTEMAKYLQKLETSGVEKSLVKQYEWSRKLILAKQEMASATKNMSEQEKANALAILDIYEETVNTAIKANQAVTNSEKRNQEVDKKFSVKDLREKAKEKQSQKEDEFFAQQGITSEKEKAKIRKLSTEDFSQQDVDNDKKTLKKLEEAKQSEQEIRARLTVNSALYEQNREENIQTKEKLQSGKGPKEQYRKIIKRTQDAMDTLQKNNEVDSAALQETKKNIKEYSKKGITEESIQTRETALKFREAQQETKLPQTTKDLKNYSFGQQDIEEYFSFGEILDKNVGQEFEKIKEQLFDTSVVGDYIVAFEKHNNQLDISLSNYESLVRQSIKYEAQLMKLENITSELDEIDLSAQAQYEGERDSAKAEVEKAETKIKAGGETPENVEALRKAKEKYAKTEEILAKVQKKNSAASEKATKLLKGNKKQLLEMAKQAGYSEKAIEELNQEIDNLNPKDAQNIEKIKSTIGGLTTVAQRTKEAFSNMAGDMANALGEEIGTENIKAKAEALEEVRQSVLQQTEAEDQAILVEEEFANSTKDISTAFEDAVGAIGAMAGALGGLQAGIDQFFNAFEEGNSPLETFMSLLGAVISIAPAVGMAIGYISKIKSAATKKEIADNKAEQISDTAEAATEVTGELAKGAASMNPVHVAAAVAGLALLGTVAAVSIGSNFSNNRKEKTRAENEANIEMANQSNELVKSISTESQEIDVLVSQYNKLNAEKANTAEITKDIMEQTDALIEKYQEYADSIKMTAENAAELKIALKDLQNAQALGDVKGIKKAQEAADYAIAKNAAEINNTGAQSILSNLSIKEGAKQVRSKEGYIVRKVGGVNGGGGTEETQANTILRKYMQYTKATNNNTNIKLRTDTPEHFVEDYENLQKAVDEMYASEDARVRDSSTNDTLRECVDLLSTYQEEYNSLKASISTGSSLKVQTAIGAAAQRGHSVSNIKNYDDYVSYKRTIGVNLDEENQDAFNAWLSTNSEVSEFVDVDKRIDALTEKTGLAREAYSKLLEEISTKAFLEVNAGIYTDPKDVEDEANRIQNEFDRKDIQANIKAHVDVGELLKPEGMTEEDWTKIAESELFKDDPKAFQNFMNQSYGSQIASLSKSQREQEQADIELLEKNIESYKQTLKTTDSAAAWDAAKTSLEIAQQELAIKLKVREAQERYIKDLRASDIVDIYHDINKSLSQLERQYRKIQQIQNDTFGEDTISLYDDLIENLDKQNEKIEDRIALNREEAAFKQNQFVQKHQDNFGMAFEFDSDGNLLNYNELTERLLARGHSEEEIETLLEEWKNDYAEYSEYINLIYNDLDKLEENERYKKELNFKKITATVDLTIEINDMKLKKYEYEINKTLKDISTSADALDIYNQQLTGITTLTGQYSTEVKELEDAYKAEEITKADYVAGLQETYDQTFNNLQVLEELKQAIMNFYGEQLSKAAEEIDKYTSKMESATSVLDHYQTLLGLINESSGESMRAVVEAQVATSKDIFEASKNEYAFYKDQADGARAKLANFTGDKKSDAYKEIENEVKAAEEKEKESLDRMYSNAAEWAENIRAKVEFELTEAAKTVEKNYLESFKDIEGNIQFSSYDEVLTAMERKSLLQEDFLTSTNKTYELNKMINQLERDALKTDNVRAKQKLESFKTELKNLQQSGKLSKAELDIKQKEYELTLAEIALEEAQNAKSVVRLTRTADGGFGYVYTADENATAEAEQNKADAENALYNAKLEVQNNYTQKTIQAQSQFHQEMQDLTQRYINGEIASEEEFQRQKEALWSYYSQLIGDYSGILSSDLVHDSLVAKDAWSKDFQDMALDMDGWTNSITGEEGYFAKIDGALSTWASDLSEFKGTVGLEFTDISDNVGTITTKVGELKTALGDKNSGVIKELQGFMTEVNTWLTGNAGTFLSNISNLATTFEKLAANILKTVNAAKTADGVELPGDGTDSNPPKTIGTEKDGYKAAGKSEWKAAYTAALKGQQYVSNHNFSDTDSEEFKQGYQKSIDDAIALGTAHRNAGTGLKGTDYTAGAVYSGDGNTLSHEAAKQINESYYTNLMKAKNGEQVDTNFISVDNRPEDIQDKPDEPEEKGLGTYGVLAAFIQGTLGDYYGQKAKEVLDQNLNSLDPSTRQAFEALGEQYLSKRNREKIEPILSKMIDEDVFDIPSLKKALSFDVAKKYMDLNKEVTVSYADWNALDLAVNGDPYYNFGHSKTYKVKELVNDDYVEPVLNGEIRWAHDDKGIQTLRRYIISNTQIADLISTFDTGGYTGSWGPEGKMAMLHEKELVLNKQDTANLLESVQLLRSILTTIDLQATNAQLSSLLSSSYFAPSTAGETLEQNVHIEASFPNVTDRSEIEEAFNTLVNRASQYANRKR